MTIARTVRPVHFEDFSGSEFERLVFAYHLCDGWTDLAWFGQTGSDQGRDIVGTRPFDDQPDERTVIQCVNRGSLTQAKAEKDMAAAANAVTGKPDAFKFVCRGNVSAQRRDEVRSAAAKLGVPKVAIWSGAEFEEHLRLRAEFLLRRLVEGVPFPDSEVELRNFVDMFQDVDDEQALAMFARAFPAAVHRDLVAYSEILGRGTGQAAPDPVKLIVPMIERFMATDRGFVRARRGVDQLSGPRQKSST